MTTLWEADNANNVGNFDHMAFCSGCGGACSVFVSLVA